MQKYRSYHVVLVLAFHRVRDADAQIYQIVKISPTPYGMIPQKFQKVPSNQPR